MRLETQDDPTRRDSPRSRKFGSSAIGEAIRRRTLWVVAPVLVCLIGSTVAVNLVKPRYTAQSRILIESQDNRFTRPDGIERETTQLPDDEAVQSQLQLVTSRDIARNAIKILGLQGNPDFDPLAAGRGPITKLLVLFGLERDPLRAEPEDRILATYYDRLSVIPVVKSRVLKVQFSAGDPDLAATAANTVADLYIQLQAGAKRDSARAAADSLASLIAVLRAKAAAAETKLQDYRAQHGLLVQADGDSVTAQELSGLGAQLVQAHAAQADAEARAKLLRDMLRANRISEVPDVANNDLVRRISDQRMALKGQIAQQAQTLLPGHPHMQELNAQLVDLESQLRAAGEKAVRSLDNEARIAAARIDNLKATLDAQKQVAGTASANPVDLSALEQQARILKDQLDASTQNYQKALERESAASVPTEARVLSRAVAPELPSFPQKRLTVVFVTLAGLLVSLGIGVAYGLLSRRAVARDTVPHVLPVQLGREAFKEDDLRGMRLRPSLPGKAPSHGQTGPDAAEGPHDKDGDLDALLETLWDCGRHHGGVRILLVGAEQTLSILPASLWLARSLARADRVILVDCGAETNGLAALLPGNEGDSIRLRNSAGLSDLLAGQTSFAEVIHRDPLSRLHLVSAGRQRLDPASEGFDMIVEALAETYDYVLLALPARTAEHVPLQGAERADLAALFITPEMARTQVDQARAALDAAGVPEVVGVNIPHAAEPEQVRSAA